MRHPDEIDLRIVREFGSPNTPQWNVRESYAKVAKRVGVDEETVRKRTLRMRRAGLLPRWLMKPNPCLLGCQWAGVDVKVEGGSKQEVLSKIARLDGVITVLNFLGSGIMVSLYYQDDDALDMIAERLGSICGSGPVVWRQDFPQPGHDMKKIDWAIVREMADDARMDLRDVASRTGATLRTVQRRLAKMMEGRAVYLSVQPDYGEMTGLTCNFLVFCPVMSRKKALDREVLSELQGIERSDTSSRDYSMFVVDCKNPREADETLRWLRGLDGAGWVRMGIMKEIIHAQGWLRREVAKRASD